MARITFDLDALRSFVVGIELGGFAKAADRLGRSTSAVSAQLKKLDAQAGAPILRKAGRGLALTPTGETLLAFARRLIELNDEAAAAVRGVELEGWARIGMQEDFGETLLPEALGRFARAHPKVRVEARVERNAALIDGVRSGKLDLALAWSGGATTPYAETVAETAMRWIGPAGRDHPWRPPSGEPLPLAAMEAPCLFRAAACDALDRARVSWRLAFVSASLAGVWAATAAGLGLTVRTAFGLPAGARALADGEGGLPRLPSLGLTLHRAEAEPGPATRRLAAIIAETVHEAARGAAAWPSRRVQPSRA
jgi:DNA-binding transcriptional LysR family regulator